MTETEENRLKRAIQETLVDLLQHLQSAQEQAILHRALGRFPANLWPFSVDIPPSTVHLSDPSHTHLWLPFKTTVDMLANRDVQSTDLLLTIDEMLAIYTKAMGVAQARLLATRVFEPLVVRLYDGMDHLWCDVATGDLERVLRAWCEHTHNGTQNTHFDHIDYYRIFPAADTRMLFNSEDSKNPEDAP